MAKMCSIKDCDKPHEARGWCQRHYRRWQKYGDTSVVKTNSSKVTKHGLSGVNGHPLYRKWIGMRQRCRDANCSDYKNYGGRGIAVDARWEDPVAFVSWGETNGWQPGYHFHRKDNDGPYSPENCEILTFKEHMARHGQS